MTSSSFGLSDAQPWRGRCGHWAPQLLIVAILGVIALGLRPAPPTLATLAVSTGLFGFVIATWLMMRQHDRRLCESCAAAMPLNPAEAAGRHRGAFWLVHRSNKPQYVLPYLAVLIASNFLTSASGRVVWALVQATMIYLILASTNHRKLQPWCPWCSGDGGGEDRPSWDTDTPRGDRRQLV